MIRKATLNDLNILVSLVYNANQQSQMNSVYMPKAQTDIHKEIMRAITESMARVYVLDNQIQGVITYFQTPNNTVDVMGPFVLKEDLVIAKALLEDCINQHNPTSMNFFVHSQSQYYKQLMNHVGASINEYEVQLQCERSNFVKVDTDLHVRKASTKNENAIASLHKKIFNNIYLTSEQLLIRSRFDHLYDIFLNETWIGYALLIPKQETAYLEVFAIDPRYQNQGYGTQSLFLLMQEAFIKLNAHHVFLIVDVVNKKALNLYTKLGFKVVQSLISYRLIT